MIILCRAWHDIIALGKHTQSEGVEHDLPLSPLYNTHTRTIFGGHAFIAFGLHTLLDDVRRCMTAWALGNINGQTTSNLTCHHCPWVSHTVGLCRAWHAHITHRLHTWSHDIERRMPSSPLGSTQNQMTSGVACHHRTCEPYTVGRRRASHAIIALGKITGRTTSLRYAIITLAKHTRLDDVGRGMLSSPM